MNNCNSCGASFRGESFVKSWTCEYCGQVNYNKEFLEKHIQTIDTAKVSNLMQLAIVSYKGREFEKSLGIFEKVLNEDSDNIDAWVYAALSAAQVIDLNNLDATITKVESYLTKASEISATSDVYLVGRNVANELICTTLLRGGTQRFEEAKKVYFAYSSVDEKLAKLKANEQIIIMLSYLEPALKTSLSNPILQCEIASLAMRGCQFYFGACPNSDLYEKAKTIILSFKDNNPSLFQKYANVLTNQSRNRQGCSSVFVSQENQPIIGRPVKILLLIVGSLLALLIIAALVSNTPETATQSNQPDRQVAVVETAEYDARGNLTKKTIESKINYDKEAEEYFRQGKIDEAINSCNKAISSNPNDSKAYYQRSVGYFQKGNFDEAITDCNKSIEIDPNFANVYFARGTVYLKKGDFSKAISDANRALRINSNFAEAYNLRGNAYRKKGDISKAMQDFNRSIEIDPNAAPTYHNRSLAYRKKGDLDRSIADSTRAVELYPNLAEAYYVRGITYFQKKEYNKSWEDIHKAESLGLAPLPEDIEALKKASGRER